jgi:aromatic ring-opening dioxygenase LigB subunit
MTAAYGHYVTRGLGELLEFDEAFCDRAAECGHRSFVIMAGCFDGVRVRAAKLSYEGPFGVGYGVASFLPETTVTQIRSIEKALCRAGNGGY